jgi:hypothetical protein
LVFHVLLLEALARERSTNSSEFKAYFIERFKGILHLTVKNADKTRSAVPDWAKLRIWEAWNVRITSE